jgi:hypothetical protein
VTPLRPIIRSMRPALVAAACLLLSAGCNQATPVVPSAPASLPITDLRSSIPTSVSPTATLVPISTSVQPTLEPTTPPTLEPTPAPTPIDLTPTPGPTPAPTLPPPPSSPPTPQGTAPIALATPWPECVDGWISPAAGSAEYAEGLELIESQMGVTGPWTVDEMRYFTGPDVPWIIDPHFDVVYYWYVRGNLTADPTFHGRWIVEKRDETRLGVAAVAPYDTDGYESPNWTAFEGDGQPQAYIGLPGEWAGIPYDFVTGEGDGGQPGLPDEVVGCLADT